MLDRKRGRLAAIAAAAYFDIVKKVDGGALKFRVNRFRCGRACARGVRSTSAILFSFPSGFAGPAADET